MGREIEKKFLVENRDWERMGEGIVIHQGYFPTMENVAVRVRIAGGRAFLTVKGPWRGAERSEYEYGIPVEDARGMMMEFCLKPLIEKVRYRIARGDHTWEIDVFRGDNEGLVVAEIELRRPDEPFEMPDWVRREVTGDLRYNNSWLVGNPYRTWSASAKEGKGRA